MDLDLKGKNVLVTGGTHGIGRAIVWSLAREGCNVCFVSSHEKRVLSLVEDLESIQEERCVDVLGLVQDLTQKDAVRKCLNSIRDKWSSIDILVNNIGGGGRWGSDSWEMVDLAVWQDVMQKNLLVAVEFTTELLSDMIKKKWGRIITIASVFGKEGGGRPWFAAAKAAEIGMMKSFSKNRQYVRNGITFNTVAPGFIDIRNNKIVEALAEPVDVPMIRYGTPEEVANLVTFLCSDKASYINGACITVDGGLSNSY